MNSIIDWVKRNPVQVSSLLVALWTGLQVFDIVNPTEQQNIWVTGFIALAFGVPAAARSDFGRASTGAWLRSETGDDYGD